MMEFFDSQLYQRALVGALLIGFSNGFVSAYVVMNRSPLKLSALSHSLLPGIVLAVWLVGLTAWSAFIGAVSVALLMGLSSVWLAKKTPLDQDTVLAVLYTGCFAGGLAMLNRLQLQQELEGWLFGNILSLSNADLWLSFSVGVLAVVVFSLFRRSILMVLFESEVAKTLGVPVNLVRYGVFALLIMVLMTTFQAVGCILAIGLIVMPGATVRQLTHSVTALFCWSGIIGAIGASLGLLVSYWVDLPAGASIVLVQIIFFIIAFIYKILIRYKA